MLRLADLSAGLTVDLLADCLVVLKEQLWVGMTADLTVRCEGRWCVMKLSAIDMVMRSSTVEESSDDRSRFW